MNEYMRLAYREAEQGCIRGEGGPFGVVIVSQEGEVIARAHNQVLFLHDPTAHAEIQAIRQTGAKLGTHDLHGCVLYTTCEPCPMCLAAILWANIRSVYFACDQLDAAGIGFRDALFYQYFRNGELEGFSLQQIDRRECLPLFVEYSKQHGRLY